MDESLWPARNVAEHAYCPRLFYLMEVEGVHLPSADTEKGLAVHHRVDQPSNVNTSSTREQGTLTTNPTRERGTLDDVDSDKPKSVRKLTLTSSRLGLTATLDLAEIVDQTAVPVEYRKGRPKRVFLDSPSEEDDDDTQLTPRREPWPTDRAQVGLQVILLEEAGYSVPEAILYYAAEKLRLRVPVDDTLRSDALATLEAAKKTAAGPRPLPLVNDPRCHGCSLQPFCLPDEVNHERDATAKPRKLWPPRDDGIHLVAQAHGTRIGVRGECLRVTDKDGALVKETPLASVESLAVLGHVQVSTQALQVLADKSIPVAFLSGAGRLVALVDPIDSVSADVRRAQVRVLDREEKRLELARALVAAKIANQRTLLMRNLPSPLGGEGAGVRGKFLDELLQEINSALKAHSLDSVRGHEGQAAALYFAHFASMFKSHVGQDSAPVGPVGQDSAPVPNAGQERNPILRGVYGWPADLFDAHGRQRRPPPDPINAVLSFAYTILTHECVAALRVASLEPGIGALHTSRPGRPALALDLLEPFRPLIADSVALSAFNRGELVEGHFVQTAAGCILTDHGRRAFFGAYGRRMDTEVTHPVFGYKLSYRRMLTLHARLIAAWLLGEVPTLAFLTTR
ncbi:MAG: CRISPR-associated endonuclease Cas1 [Gemmataceae bacterium]|nr:CRISPR-associated endonuclease Cas1 [Gemmataceae bacterium]MCI0743100.1 CRISPR-associated endonuclease Cas1 [Gemmataceae bacterium]